MVDADFLDFDIDVGTILSAAIGFDPCEFEFGGSLYADKDQVPFQVKNHKLCVADAL
jgi:hypothetical protein